MGPTGLPSVPGEPDTTVQTALPPVPRLPNVTAQTTGDSVTISVVPVQGAKDYRVYALPDDGDISSTADGYLTVRNAIYRCAGDRETPTVAQDAQSLGQSEAVKTLVDKQDVDGFTRTLDQATLGYVYVAPGDGRVPVYALGDPAPNGDNTCFWQRWGESRAKRYVSSGDDRQSLLSAGWRDDGPVFYVPAMDGDGTKPVYEGGNSESRLYWVDGPEADKRGSGKTVFSILRAAMDDTVPLMRVHYQIGGCGHSHDELTVSEPRFERARTQGDALPLSDLLWSGITGPTTLVVEALDQGCPFPGVLAPVSRAASTDDQVDYPDFYTLDDLKAKSSTGELFVNGQHDPGNKPRPIARSFIKVSPTPKPALDWYAGFGPDETIPNFMSLGFNEPCENPDNPNCLREYRQKSDFGDISFTSDTPNRNGIAPMLGQLWVTFADVGADVGGHFRLTPNPRATMAPDSYLHVTMEVDAYTTARRYPQMIVSDGDVPVQWHMKKSNTLIVQTFADTGTPNWPFAYQIEICDHRGWEVNDQCPASDLYRLKAANGSDNVGLSAGPEVGEHTGADRSTHFDAFLSTKRAYLFLDNEPYGCLDLPSKGVPSGTVTVTFGDVIYHSGVDSVFTFHKKYQQTYAKRHFDNLGFKSGVAAPTWDQTRFPCQPPSTVK